MIGALSRWRKPDKQTAYDAALQRGAKLGIKKWVVPREQMDLGVKIGAGGFGTVFKCKLNGNTAVAKQIAPARLAAKDLPLLQNEMCLWAQLDHPNCVKFFGVCFEPTDFYYLLCEFMPGGSLFDRHHRLRSQSKRPTPPQTPQMLIEWRQVAGAMDHLHDKQILHRDLKSANVLVAEDGRLVVADFGLVRYCQSDAQANMTAETGSYRWMAPEVIRHEPYGTGCDVYSFGVLCWEMLSYSIPFPHHTPVEVALSVATKGMRPEMPAHAPSVLVGLIEQCWQQEALLRPSFAKICSRIDAIEGATALRELPGPEAVLIGERPVADYSSSVETLPVSGFEGQASPSSSGRASPGEKRKCSEARTDSSRPGATVIVVNMGSGAPEMPTPQSPYGSPKGTDLKRPKSAVDLASLGSTASLGPSVADASGVDGEAPALREGEAPFSLDEGGVQLFSNGFDTLQRPKSVDSNLASWSKSALTM